MLDGLIGTAFRKLRQQVVEDDADCPFHRTGVFMGGESPAGIPFSFSGNVGRAPKNNLEETVKG